MFAEDGLDMSPGVALRVLLGEVLAWLCETVLLFVDGVACCLPCYALIGVEGVTVDELLATINSSLSSCGMHALTLIVFSKLPSHASSSMNYTYLLIMTFLVNGL